MLSGPQRHVARAFWHLAAAGPQPRAALAAAGAPGALVALAAAAPRGLQAAGLARQALRRLAEHPLVRALRCLSGVWRGRVLHLCLL